MKIRMNKVIKFLIFSDVALTSGIGFITPIFAIFLTERIKGGNVEIAGYAAAIYWLVISLTVVPFGWYLDRNHGEKDDFWFIIIGNILAALAIVGFIFSSLAWHMYLCQSIYALGMSMNIAAYAAIFTRHIDKGKESFDWSIRVCLIGFGTSITGAVGGIIANRFGFTTLLICVLIFVLISSLIPFFIYKNIFSKKEKILKIPRLKDIK